MYQPEKKEKWYEFGPFQLRLPERLLVRSADGQVVSLTPKALETLRVLLERSPHVVEKDDLLKEVWSETVVEEATLAQNIFTLRKVLAEHDATSGDEQQSYIATVPKRGYRFSAPVRIVLPEVVSQSQQKTESLHLKSTVLQDVRPEEKPTVDSVLTEAGSPPDSPAHKEYEDLTPRNAEQQEAPRQTRTNSNRFYLLPLSALVFLLVLASLIYWQWNGKSRPAVSTRLPFQMMNVTSLNTSERIVQAAISPDGKYIAYAAEDGGKQNLCVRQVVAVNTICIVPPATVNYLGLTFSHDGNYIYYVSNDMKDQVWNLHRMPVFGGAVEQLVTDIDTAVTLSPDGEQLAFIRYLPQRGEAALMIAQKNGAQERKLISYKHYDYFPLVAPAWSPDGSKIAFASNGLQSSDFHMNVAVIEVSDGQITPINNKQWIAIEEIRWLNDGSGLLAIARDESRLAQIWHLSYPAGEVSRVTNDLNYYHGLSLTRDARTMVTIQYDRLSSLWVGSPGKEQDASQLTTGKFDGFNGITWAPDRRILYTVRNGNALDIWAMDAEGKNKRQLTDGQGLSNSPDVSPDGETIVYVLNRNGVPNLWLMDGDGKNHRQLTFGGGERSPSFTPDGRWIVYTNVGGGRSSIWKVPVAGGQPQQLTDRYSRSPVVSPNGDVFVCYYWNERPEDKAMLALIPLNGGAPVKTFDLPADQLVWAPDGKGLTYVNNREKVSNIWYQPIDGGKPRKLTNFANNEIFNFSWSEDGKQIAYASGSSNYDLLMFTHAQ